MDEAQKIAELANAASQASGAAQNLAELLQQAAKATGSNATAASASAQKLQESASAAANTRAGLEGLGRTATSTITGFVTVTSSVYGADKAFTSVIPTLDSMGSIAMSITDALGKLGSGTSVFGISLGRATEGLAAMTNLGFDVLLKGLKFQLEGAQKVSDSYLHLSQVGATFGGSLEEMAEYAKGAKVPIQEFTKIIQANVESISKLGIGMSKGGATVAGMAKDIYRSNGALLGLYGNLTELSKGTADYLALQSQLGINIKENYHDQLRGAQEYLLRQKELSSITGKNAETLKREEEGRRKQLDYNLKLGRLGDVAKANVQEGMTMAGKLFGDAGAKYAEEYFATGGQVYTKEALAYQAMNQEAADTIAQFMTGVDTDAKTYRDKNSQYLKDNASALEAWAKSLEDMASINRAAQNPLLAQQTETASAIIANLNLIKNSTEIFKDIAADRAQAESGRTPDKLTEVMVNAERQRMETQRTLDAITLKNMESLGEVVKILNAVTVGYAQGMDSSVEMMKKFIEGLRAGTEGAKDALEGFSRELGNAIRRQLGVPEAMGATPEERARNEALEANRNLAGNLLILNDTMREMIRQNERNRTYNPAQPSVPYQPQTATPAQPGVPYQPQTATPAQPQPQAQPTAPDVTQRAEGGLTTGKTIVGEAGTEAVIPLKNGAVPLKIDLTQLVQAMAEQSQLTKDVIRELQDSNDLTKKLIDYTT